MYQANKINLQSSQQKHLTWNILLVATVETQKMNLNVIWPQKFKWDVKEKNHQFKHGKQAGGRWQKSRGNKPEQNSSQRKGY